MSTTVRPLRFAWFLLLAALVAASVFVGAAAASEAIPDGSARIHYERPDGDYAGWVLHVWGDARETVSWAEGLPITGIGPHGAYWDVRLADDAERVGFIVHKGDIKDPGPDMFLLLSQHGREIWLVSGSDRILTAPPIAPPADDTARVHYYRPDAAYDGWVLHLWEDTTESVTWDAGLAITGTSDYGVFWDVGLTPDAQRVGFIVHRGDVKDPGPDMFLELDVHGNEIWLVSGSATIHAERPDVRVSGGGNIRTARAHWVRRDLIAWDVGLVLPGAAFELHVAADGGLELADGALEGGDATPLTIDPDGLPADVLRQFPHLASATALRMPSADTDAFPAYLQGQVALTLLQGDRLQDATGLQIAGVLDDLYATDAPLGVTWDDGTPSIALWAPTARSVTLQRFADATGDALATHTMDRDDASGVWSVTGDPSWRWHSYLFEVEVFVPATGRVERNVVTDPYSLSLAMNSARSQIVDLRDPSLAPDGWDELVKPGVADPVDIVVYELHVRDFSAADPLVPSELAGTYLAFTQDGHGARHLRNLAGAGLTHLHLLPTFDLATIDEDRSTWLEPEIDVDLPHGGVGPQQAVEAVRDRDGFNWGYDPWHYNVPEGSYATDPQGPARIREFREMVMALWDMDLRLVVDVVYNHTNAAGQGSKSVLDRIVPGYYHRLDANGGVTTSSCCPNTATEHAMMERLMIDSVRLWAEHYKVDGFRFDLMGHHMKRNMLAVREALDALSVEVHGVDGPAVYVYGEGWNFGEVADGARGTNATQRNMAGTGIGTFNDRLRDAVRGGGPFDGGIDLVANQGFASGRGVLPNDVTSALPRDAQHAAMLRAADQIRVGLAGNLEAFTFESMDGTTVRGDDVDYNGQPAGYGRVPQDHVVYVSKHDNQTLWDILQYKLPRDLATEDRVRAQLVALSTVMFSQGVPFFHAGSDLLRSKSFDRNSYDSGDWFNAIDWTMTANGMGRGLPLAGDNRDNWALMRDRLVDPLLHPSPDDIAFAAAVFQEYLRVRRDSPLLRLRTAEDVMARVSFHDTGPDGVPGVIVMEIHDDVAGLPVLDPAVDRLLVVFNATDRRVSLVAPALAGRPYLVHPEQATGADADTLAGAFVLTANGRLGVPAFSTVVFVAPALD
jgi:pullulanase